MIGHWLMNLLFPPKCVLCGRLPKAQSMEHLDSALLVQILQCIEESLA